MQLSVSLRILGILLMSFSTTMLVPLSLALLADDHTIAGFVTAPCITFLSGLAMWFPVRRVKKELRIRDGFLITSLFWGVLGLFGGLPFALTDALHLTPAEAAFESISGLTATGATVISGLDDLPRSILLWRQLLQWMGGLGVVVVAMAILPMLGIGGMQLYKAETPGPSKDSKLTPRITETAKALFSVYLLLTIACALAYYFAGMSEFDAIGHAFSTIAIGGFSTHDASMGYFDNDTILLIASLFMTLSAINFGLHFTAWRRRSPTVYRKDAETRFFITVLFSAVAIIASYLAVTATLSPWDSFIHGMFQTISIATTTGFATQNFSAWPSFIPILLMLLACMGGCAGSTASGMKAVRVMLIGKQGVRELKQLVHPNAIIPLKIGRRRVEATIVSAVWSFFAVYTASYLLIMLALMATGLDFLTAFSGVAATINNLGVGLGGVASNFGPVSETGTWIMCFTMLLGRLEVFTVLVLFTPMFWQK